MSVTTLFFWGLALGMVSSLPLGPINLNVLRLLQSGRRASAGAFVAGVVLADVGVAALALLGLVSANIPPEILRVISAVGGAAFVFFGLWGLLRPASVNAAQRSGAVSFVSGVLFCGLNPGFYLFWVYAATFAAASVVSPLTGAAFLAGVLIGDLCWFTLFTKLVGLFHGRLSPRTWSSLAGGLIIAFGLFALWGAYHGHFQYA